MVNYAMRMSLHVSHSASLFILKAKQLVDSGIPYGHRWERSGLLRVMETFIQACCQ